MTREVIPQTDLSPVGARSTDRRESIYRHMGMFDGREHCGDTYRTSGVESVTFVEWTVNSGTPSTSCDQAGPDYLKSRQQLWRDPAPVTGSLS